MLGSPAPQQQQHPTPTPPLPQPPLHSLLQLQFSGAAEAYYHRLLAARSKPIEAYAATEARLSWLLALPLSWILVALPLRWL